jgi:hypothetical protein
MHNCHTFATDSKDHMRVRLRQTDNLGFTSAPNILVIRQTGITIPENLRLTKSLLGHHLHLLAQRLEPPYVGALNYLDPSFSFMTSKYHKMRFVLHIQY